MVLLSFSSSADVYAALRSRSKGIEHTVAIYVLCVRDVELYSRNRRDGCANGDSSRFADDLPSGDPVDDEYFYPLERFIGTRQPGHEDIWGVYPLKRFVGTREP